MVKNKEKLALWLYINTKIAGKNKKTLKKYFIFSKVRW